MDARRKRRLPPPPPPDDDEPVIVSSRAKWTEPLGLRLIYDPDPIQGEERQEGGRGQPEEGDRGDGAT